MKKILLTAVAALGVFVACEKDEFEALDSAFAAEINRVENASNAADDVLQGNIDSLRNDFNDFVVAINDKVDAAVAALEAADQAITDFFNAAVADLQDKLDKAVVALNASIDENTELIKETGKELRKLIVAEAQARVAGDLALANELADQVEKLEKQDSIAARQIGRNFTQIGNLGNALLAERAARISADADLQSQVTSNTLNIADNLASIQTNINDINLNFLDITSNDGDISAINGELDGHDASIASLQASLTATIADLDAVAARLLLVEAFDARITTAQLEVDALELVVIALDADTHSSQETVDAINTAIGNLRTDIEGFATRGDAALESSIDTQLDAIDALIAQLRIDVDANDDDIAAINAQLGTISSTLTRLEGRIQNADANNTTLIGQINALSTRLDGIVAANATQAELDALQASIDALTLRVAAVEEFGGQITALGVRITALEGVDNATMDELNAEITRITGVLQAYADTNDADTIFDATALQAAIDALGVRIDGLPTGGGSDISLTWSPAFDGTNADHLDGFEQTASIEGAELTRTVVVSSTSVTRSEDNFQTPALGFSYTLGGSVATASSLVDAQTTIQESATSLDVVVITEARTNTPNIYTTTTYVASVEGVGNIGQPYVAPEVGPEAGTEVAAPLTHEFTPVNTPDSAGDWDYSGISNGPNTDALWAEASFDFGATASSTVELTRNRVVTVNVVEDSPALDASETKTFTNSYVAPNFDPSTVTSWTPAFGSQEADFVQNGVDGNSIAGTRNIVVSTASSTIYEYRITAGGERTTRGYASQDLAEDAAEAIAGDRNVQILIYSRTSTWFVASEGLGTSTPVPGSYEDVRTYTNPGYSAPVDLDDDTISWGNFQEVTGSRSPGTPAWVYDGTSYNSEAEAVAAAELALPIGMTYNIDVNVAAGSYDEMRSVIYSQGADGFDDDLTIAREDGTLAGEGDSETVTRAIASTSVPTEFTTSVADPSTGGGSADWVTANGVTTHADYPGYAYATPIEGTDLGGAVEFSVLITAPAGVLDPDFFIDANGSSITGATADEAISNARAYIIRLFNL